MAAETTYPLFEIVKLGIKKHPRCYFHSNFNRFILDAEYGWKHTSESCREGLDLVIPGEKYELHHQILPKEGDIIRHIKTGREFTVGKVEGFVCYNAPLLENGNQVSTLLFEDYYKG